MIACNDYCIKTYDTLIFLIKKLFFPNVAVLQIQQMQQSKNTMCGLGII